MFNSGWYFSHFIDFSAHPCCFFHAADNLSFLFLMIFIAILVGCSVSNALATTREQQLIIHSNRDDISWSSGQCNSPAHPSNPFRYFPAAKQQRKSSIALVWLRAKPKVRFFTLRQVCTRKWIHSANTPPATVTPVPVLVSLVHRALAHMIRVSHHSRQTPLLTLIRQLYAKY